MLGCRTLLWMAVGVAAAQQSQVDEARRLQSEGKAAAAIALLESRFHEAPEDLDAGRVLAWLYASTGEPSRAIDVYRRLLGAHRDSAELHGSLGASLLEQGSIEEARAELERAIELEPGLVAAHYNLGLLKFRAGELDGAARGFARAAELDPSRAHYFFMLARAHRAAYELDDAVAAFRAGLSRTAPPDAVRAARLELALTLRHAGRFGESETELRGLVETDPDDGEALFQLGRLCLATNRYPEAEATFRRFAEASPGDARAHFMLGLVTYREDAPERAALSFRRLLEVAPRHAEGLYYLGMSLLKLDDTHGARRAFEETLEIDPNHVGATYNLALLLARQGERDASAERFERFRELGERRERLETLEERVRWNPDNATLFLELGREYARQKRAQDALRAFQRALELAPDLAAAEVGIADLLGPASR